MAQKLTANQIRYRREVARVGTAKIRAIWREKARRRRSDPKALIAQATRQLDDLKVTRTKLAAAVSKSSK